MMTWLITLSVLFIGLVTAFLAYTCLIEREFHRLRESINDIDIDKQAKRVFDNEIKTWWEGSWSRYTLTHNKGERNKLLDEVNGTLGAVSTNQLKLAGALGYEWKATPASDGYVKKKRAAVR